MSTLKRTGSGKLVFLCFVAFFGIITAVNAVFIYLAIHSNTGVVTENAYEKGLAYNEVLSAAKSQPQLQDSMIYEDGKIRWTLKNEDRTPIKGGKAIALFVRPVQDGYDFSIALEETAPGIYEAAPKFPVQGLWTAKLDLEWNNQQYQTAKDFMAQ